MANLIITVISIALVAVAAVMGVFYGSQAFLNAQTTAKANTVIKQAEQIKSAYILFKSNGGVMTPFYYYIDGTDFLTTGKYLSSAPQIPASTGTGYYIMNPNTVSASYLNVTITDDKICKKLNEIFSGTNNMTSNTGWSAAILQYQGYCYFFDANSNGVYNAGEGMYFYYLVAR